MNDQQGLAIASAGTVFNHRPGGLTLTRRGIADPPQLPTVCLLDIKALLRWLPAQAADGAGLLQRRPQDASPGETS